MTREEKKAVRLQICGLLDDHCAMCETKKQAIKGTKGRAWDEANQNLQKYCINECPIGIQMRALGTMLVSSSEKEKKSAGHPVVYVDLTVEEYQAKKKQGLLDHEIAKLHGISRSGFQKRKARWRKQGLIAG
nr:zinc-finger domain-containing protein [Aneurinibacillus terranovensis]